MFAAVAQAHTRHQPQQYFQPQDHNVIREHSPIAATPMPAGDKLTLAHPAPHTRS